MTWGSQPDVDLHVTEPNEFHVFYGSTRGPSGYLDVDDVTGFGPEHFYVSCGTLETGTYAIGVNYYSGSAGDGDGSGRGWWPDGSNVPGVTPHSARLMQEQFSRTSGLDCRHAGRANR